MEKLMSNTLFGYLSTKFSSSPENLATEALTYILGHSPQVARRLVNQVNAFYGVNLPEQLSFYTQAGGRIRQFQIWSEKIQMGKNVCYLK